MNAGKTFIVLIHEISGFEAYSFHSQYNLLAASMLATAWNVADESISLVI
jgi:hypothetical protein